MIVLFSLAGNRYHLIGRNWFGFFDYYFFWKSLLLLKLVSFLLLLSLFLVMNALTVVRQLILFIALFPIIIINTILIVIIQIYLYILYIHTIIRAIVKQKFKPHDQTVLVLMASSVPSFLATPCKLVAFWRTPKDGGRSLDIYLKEAIIVVVGCFNLPRFADLIVFWKKMIETP